MIKEVIVVEGKDDVAAVKAAVDAEVISTHGFGFGYKLLKTLKNIQKRRGIIIFTDPDYMGNQIRRRISKEIPDAKHAYLSQDRATKDRDIGIENAKPEDIINALNMARAESVEKVENFTKRDLIVNNLVGGENSEVRRNSLTDILGIGHCNGKQLLNKLNAFGITREEFERALRAVEDE